MKLLIINPNISVSVTELIGQEARRVASSTTTLTTMTAELGVAYIETRFEAMLGAYATAELAARHAAEHDAVIIAAFGDPGLTALREVLDIPVLGLTESALMSACMLGQRFSIIAISRRISAWYRETVQTNGLLDRLASIRTLDQRVQSIGSIQNDHAVELKALCMQAIEQDGADVLIIAGAPLAGLARAIAADIPVPLVDGVSSAVRHAESLVALGSHAPRLGSLAPPPVKPNKGLSPAIQHILNIGTNTNK
jgi:Asp/Glu/hydantoin racemase